MNPKPDELDRALTDLFRAEPPERFRSSWQSAIEREEIRPMKHASFFRRAVLPVAAALVLVIGSIAAGSLIPTTAPSASDVAPAAFVQSSGTRSRSAAVSDDMALTESYEYSESSTSSSNSMATAADKGVSDSTSTADASAERKLVRTADLTIVTDSFDEDVQTVRATVEALGGYVESLSRYEDNRRTAYYSLRVPSDRLDEFLDGLNGLGRVTDRSESTIDRTASYSDYSLRLETQRNMMTRLQELLKQADNVSDMLEIESKIADTQYQIDSYESSLRSIDRDVDDSAVTVTLREETASTAAQATELTLGERIRSGFAASVKALGDFAQNLTVFLAMALPVLVPLAALTVAIVLIVKARRRHKGKE